MRPTHLAMLAATVLLTAAAPAPVVVELFTSQGCSSCPPADALLRELSARPDVLALGFHVTYWNDLGWPDPYSLDAATDRQRSYLRISGAGAIYTPQMVVGGTRDVIGSDRRAVTAALREAAAAAGAGPALTLVRGAAQVIVELGPGSGSAHILLVGYDPEHRTKVARGENAGAELVEANIVRSLSPLGEWHGAAMRMAHNIPAGQRLAVLVQAPDGRMVAAAAEK